MAGRLLEGSVHSECTVEGGGGKSVVSSAMASLVPKPLPPPITATSAPITATSASPTVPVLASVAPSITPSSDAEGERDLAVSLPAPAAASSPEPEPLLASIKEPEVDADAVEAVERFEPADPLVGVSVEANVAPFL